MSMGLELLHALFVTVTAAVTEQGYQSGSYVDAECELFLDGIMILVRSRIWSREGPWWLQVEVGREESPLRGGGGD